LRISPKGLRQKSPHQQQKSTDVKQQALPGSTWTFSRPTHTFKRTPHSASAQMISGRGWRDGGVEILSFKDHLPSADKMTFDSFKRQENALSSRQRFYKGKKEREGVLTVTCGAMAGMATGRLASERKAWRKDHPFVSRCLPCVDRNGVPKSTQARERRCIHLRFGQSLLCQRPTLAGVYVCACGCAALGMASTLAHPPPLMHDSHALGVHRAPRAKRRRHIESV